MACRERAKKKEGGRKLVRFSFPLSLKKSTYEKRAPLYIVQKKGGFRELGGGGSGGREGKSGFKRRYPVYSLTYDQIIYLYLKTSGGVERKVLVKT